MWSGRCVFAGPEGVVDAGIVVSIHVNRLLGSDGETACPHQHLSVRKSRNARRWHKTVPGGVHSTIDQAQHVPWAADHVPFGCAGRGSTKGARVTSNRAGRDRTGNVVRLVHIRRGNAKTGA